ncbi:YveK family protein [Gordonia sp. NPDC003422]
MEFFTLSWLVLKRRWPVLVAAVAIALIAVGIFNATQREESTASATLFLRAPDVKSSASAYQGDLFSRQRALTYQDMFKSDDLAQLVIDKLSLSTSPEALAAKVHASTVKDTVLLTVSVTDSNPQQAADLANAYASVFGQFVARMENVQNNADIPPLVTLVRAADAASAVRGGYPMWQLITAALVAAAILSGLLIWLLEHFDTKIRTRAQVESLSDVPVLGVVPEFDLLNRATSVAEAYAESDDFADAIRRLSVNVEYRATSLVHDGLVPVVAVLSDRPETGKSVLVEALVGAYEERGLKATSVRIVATNSSQLGVPVFVGRGGAQYSSLAELKVAHDIILLDGGASAGSALAQVAAEAADAVLVVIRPAQSTTVGLGNTLADARIVETPVIGVAVNRADEANTLAGVFV